MMYSPKLPGEKNLAIRLRGIKTAFGPHVVHEDLDLDIRRGEVIGVIGPSGCGKSVLLRAIIGLKEPAAGSVEVFGRNVLRMSESERDEVERRWGVMFQDGALFSNLTVRENVMVPMVEHVDLPEELTASDLQQYYTVETFARLIREFYVNAPETGPQDGEETLCRDFKIVGAESGELVAMPSGDDLIDAWVKEQVEAIRPKP